MARCRSRLIIHRVMISAKLWQLDTNNTPNLGKPGQSPPSPAAPLWLGHTLGIGLDVVPLSMRAGQCAGCGVPVRGGHRPSNTGQTMVVANYYNDSISILTGGYGAWSYFGGSAATANVVCVPVKA